MARSDKAKKNPIEVLLQDSARRFFGSRKNMAHATSEYLALSSMEKRPTTATFDLLVDTSEKTGPWFPAGLIEELEQVFGKRVDVATSNGLYGLLRRRILKEARSL